MESAKPNKNNKSQAKAAKHKKRDNWASSLRDAESSLNFLVRNQHHKYDHELLKKTLEESSESLSRASEEPESSDVPDVRVSVFECYFVFA